MKSHVEVAVIARLKLGALWRGVKRLGSQAALARHLGVQAGMIGEWLALQSYPTEAGRYWPTLDVRLAEIGLPPVGEIWPDELKVEIDRRHTLGDKKWGTVEAIRSVPVEALAGIESRTTETVLALELAEDAGEVRARVVDALRFLTDRQAQAVRSYYGLDGGNAKGFVAVARELGVTTERARQIILNAQYKMSRIPSFQEFARREGHLGG